MSIYVTGDVHGNPAERFEQNPHITKSLTKDDTVIILGDVGIPWPHDDENNERQFKWLSEKPWNTVFLLGNHDNYDWAESQPCGFSYVTYNNNIYGNISVYDKMDIVYLEGKRILLIPGAESHDCSIYLDPSKEGFEDAVNYCLFNRVRFRVKGLNWWEQEPVDVDKVLLIAENPDVYGKFDFVLSHDYPGRMNDNWKRPGYIGREESTYSQIALEKLRETLDFDKWYHGHAHDPYMPWDAIDNRVHCIYKSIVKIN